MSAEVEAIIGRYLTKVKRSGPEHIMAVCPFHRRPDGSDEHTPSFTMSLTIGVYHCFSCHESGGLRNFLKEMGVPSTRIDGEYKYVIEECERYRAPPANPLHITAAADPLPESLLGLFDHCPTSLLREGFDEGLLAKLDVGFDKRHRRITFPLRDHHGCLVGISGRTVDDEWPRYKIYDCEYQAWDLPVRATKKRSLIWNFHAVQPQVYFGKGQCLVIVEGFKACMRLLQAGITNTVALLGSYMSREQRWLIESLAPKTVYVMLDNDDAGHNGRLDVARSLAKALCDVRVVEYEADQPSDLSTTDIQTAIETATEYHLWKIQGRHLPTTVQLTPKERS
jgi:DNA primase